MELAFICLVRLLTEKAKVMRRISVIFSLLSCINALAQVEHDSTTIIYAWKLNTFYSRTDEVRSIQFSGIFSSIILSINILYVIVF
jgi:hypothetical protein